MTITIDELFELGAVVIDYEREAAEIARADTRAKEEGEIARKLALIAESTGVDEETLVNTLGLRYRSERYDLQFQFDYLGNQAGIGVVRPRGMGSTGKETVQFTDEYHAATVRESLAKFVNRAQREYAASKAELLRIFDASKEAIDLLFGQFMQKPAWCDPEVKAAAVAHLLRCPLDQAATFLINRWLENAEPFNNIPELAERRAVAKNIIQMRNKKETLLTEIQRGDDPLCGKSLDRVVGDWDSYVHVPLTRESVDMLWADAHDADLADDPDVILAMSAWETALSDWQHARVREQQRAAVELASFKPFRYYEVRYSLLGESEEGEEREVDWDAFFVLHEAHADDGYYHTLNGNVIKPVHITAVLQHEILTVEALNAKTWSRFFTQPTDFGEIRVPPPDAEFLTTDH